MLNRLKCENTPNFKFKRFRLSTLQNAFDILLNRDAI